jgi:HemY protein
MRSLFWLLAVFAAAVAVAVFSRLDQGYVRFAWGDWRVETSLLLYAILSLLAFAAAYMVVRLARHTLGVPSYVRAYRARRHREKAQAALAAAVQAWLEGRYARAEKEATRAYEGGAAPGLAAVVAARAAHELGVPERRELWIGRAQQGGLRNAALLSRGVMSLGERDYGAAREALMALQGSGARQIATLRLLLRAERGLRHWEEVLRITAQLAKRDAIAAGVAEEYRVQAHVELLAQAAADRGAFEERWLLEHEGDAPLLAALGRLCTAAELWGKAQSYFEASLSFEESRATHLDLARLLDRLEKPAEAQPHYRRAAELA